MAFPDNLRRLRLARFFSQAELARRSGVHAVTITRLEAGTAAGTRRRAGHRGGATARDAVQTEPMHHSGTLDSPLLGGLLGNQPRLPGMQRTIALGAPRTFAGCLTFRPPARRARSAGV